MEKFGLLNLLKALNALNPKNNSANDTQKTPETPTNSAPAEPEHETDYQNNVMYNVLSRHEQVANRIKNKR